MKTNIWWERKMISLGFIRERKNEFIRWQSNLIGAALELRFSDLPEKNWFISLSTLIRSPFHDADYVYINTEYLGREGIVPDGETNFHGWNESELDDLWSEVNEKILPLLQERCKPQFLLKFLQSAIVDGLPVVGSHNIIKPNIWDKFFFGSKRKNNVSRRFPSGFDEYAGIVAECLGYDDEAIFHLTRFADYLGKFKDEEIQERCRKVRERVEKISPCRGD